MTGTDRPGYHSVTRRVAPPACVGDLPPDLLAAFNSAWHLARWTSDIVGYSAAGGFEWMDRAARDGFAAYSISRAVQRIEAEEPYTEAALSPVLVELARVSDPNALFGGTSAHEAAITLSQRAARMVVLVAGRGVASIRVAIPDLGERVAASDLWQNYGEMQRAIQKEAVRAAAVRAAPSGRPPAAVDLVPRSAVGSPDAPPAWIEECLSGLNCELVKALWPAGRKVSLAELRRLVWKRRSVKDETIIGRGKRATRALEKAHRKIGLLYAVSQNGDGLILRT